MPSLEMHTLSKTAKCLIPFLTKTDPKTEKPYTLW